jgi:hypothetical protein
LMGIPDDLFHWYLLSTGWVSGEPGAPPTGALVHIVWRSPSNNGYSKAYWEAPTELVAEKEAVRAAMQKFGRKPARPF